MGTPLREVIEEIGGGAQPGRRIKAVLPGVAQGFIPESLLDTPVSYEGMAAIGSGLGSAGFIVFDDADDLVAVAAGVSRFLAVESCGQCTPCKQDGLELAELLAKVVPLRAPATHDLATIQERVATVADGARCYLATQHQDVGGQPARALRRRGPGPPRRGRPRASSRSCRRAGRHRRRARPPATSATGTSSRTGPTTRRTPARCPPSGSASIGRLLELEE